MAHASSPFVLGDEVEAGSYICLRTRSALGFLVRLFCRSPYDHTVVVTAPGRIVQATVRGVKEGPLSQFRGCLAVANVAEEMTGEQRATVVRAAESYGRDEYAFRAIVVVGLRKLGLTWPWLLKVSADEDAVFCSELAADAGQAAGLDWLCGESSPATVTPAQMAVRRGMRRVTIT